MNSLGPIVLSILAKVSVQVSILVLLILFLQWAFQKQLAPRVRAALWLLVVLRLLVPISFSSTASMFNLFSTFESDIATPRKVPAVRSRVKIFVPLTTHNSVPLMDIPVPERTEGNASGLVGDPAVKPPGKVVPNSNPSIGFAVFGLAGFKALLVLWLVGAFMLAMLVLVSSIRWTRRIRGLRGITDERIGTLLSQCRKQMGVSRELALFETPHLNTPALHGFFRPRLLFPVGFLSSFPEEQLRFIFLHELAHVRRLDIPLNWLITALQVFHWFNPLVWLAFSRWRLDRELACDSLVLEVAGPGRNKEYGRTILQLLENASHPLAAPAFVGILESKGQLRQRIGMIAAFVPAKGWSRFALVLMGVLCFTGLTDGREPQLKQNRVATNNTKKAFAADEKKGINSGLRLSGKLKMQSFDFSTGQPLESSTFQFTVDSVGRSWRIEIIDEDAVRGDRENCDKEETAYDGKDIYRMVHFPDKMLQDSLRKDGVKPPSQQGNVALATGEAGFPQSPGNMTKILWLTFCSDAYLSQCKSNATPSISSDLLRPNSTRARFTLLNPFGLPRDYKEFIPGVVMGSFEGTNGVVAIPCPPPFDKEYLAMHYSALRVTNLNGGLFPISFQAEYTQPWTRGGSPASNCVTMVLQGELLAHSALTGTDVRPEVNGDTILSDARFRNIRYVATKPGISNWLDRASSTLELEMRSKSGTPIYQRSKKTGKLSELRED